MDSPRLTAQELAEACRAFVDRREQAEAEAADPWMGLDRLRWEITPRDVARIWEADEIADANEEQA
jgi:hypothetical protein